MQASVAFSSTGLVEDAVMIMTEHADHGQMTNIASADATGCHTSSDFSCEMGHCPSCFFIITKEQDNLTMMVDIIRLENQLVKSPQYLSYRFYHPPH